MKEKRRDSKGRILHTGESQRTDGKYLYKYVDAFGNTKYVYAWRLTPTDPTPKEKREKPSLRELEQQIRRDIEDGIDSTGKKMTLCQLYAKQNLQRANVKKSTQKQREQLMRLLKEDKLGARSIDAIKPSDAKEWALRMKDKGFSYNTINNHKRSLKASFYIAIQDDCVRKNPFDFKLNEIRYNIYFHIGYTLLLGNLSDRIEALPTDAWLYPAACLRSSDSLSQTKRCSAGESLSSLTTRFAYSRESDECLLARIQRSGFRLSNLRRDGAPTRCSAMLWQFGERCPNAYCVWFPDCFRT